MIRMVLAATGVFCLLVLMGCGASAAQRDAAELREIELPPDRALEAATGVLATQGYHLQAVNARLVSASAQQNDDGERVAGTAAGAAAGPVGGAVSAAGAGPIGGILTSLSISLASGGRGKYDTQINVQVAEIDSTRTAMRATAVVNGRVNPRWKALGLFWRDLAQRCVVHPAGEGAKAALPLAGDGGDADQTPL